MSTSNNAPAKSKIFNLGGVKIEFPPDLKPYPSQLSLMAKAVTGARKAQNCLLESPTGSGKTMAMLCSLLAWQKTLLEEKDNAEKAYKAQIALQRVECYDENQSTSVIATPVLTENKTPISTENKTLISTENKTPISTENKTPISTENETPIQRNRMQFMEEWSPDITMSNLSDSMQTPVKTKAETSRSMSPDLFADEDDDMDAFKPPKKKMLSNLSFGEEKIRLESLGNLPPTGSAMMSPVKVEIASPSMYQDHAPPSKPVPPPPKMKIPKIFFATRTHKQIAQVVSELKRTPYRNVRMTVLSSREHSCIHTLLHPYTNKTEMCHALIHGENNEDGSGKEEKIGCTFKSKLDKMSSSVKANLLDYLNVETPWDIEDLVLAGKQKKCCPYYSSRDLMTFAEIVFCPYNYIIDPLIRESMGIKLEDNVIVFDEAHNIEDTIRQATSFSVEENAINEAIKTCKVAVFQGGSRTGYDEIKRVLESLLTWMKEASEHLKMQDSISQERSCVWNGTQYTAHMETIGIGSSNFERFKSAAILCLQGDDGASDTQSQEEEGTDPDGDEGNFKTTKEIYKPNQSFKILITGMMLVWNLMYKNDSKNRDDYNIVLYETTTRYFAPENSGEQGQGGWMRRSAVASQARLGLHFWCMNPALGFEDFQNCHSVIVTSGTLSPMASFQSELGVMFPHPLSTDHVIDPSQAWVATVGVGPTNKVINGTFRNAITLEYQDEVGNAILNICQAVPFGVLCFFPSYATLDNVMKRWQLTGKWNQLLHCKYVIKEPRKQAEFLEAMSDFDHAVRRAEVMFATEGNAAKGQTGALFLAVFRGKLSEGIDFKDNHARAVITVSIPFPSMSDLNVKLKKKYNDKNNLVNRQLLPGNQWYEIQAYRAINQALGRCIRHRNDWGAIIMLDNRFTTGSKATASLSKWATKQIRHFQEWDDMYTMLQEFMQKRLALQQQAATKVEEVIDLT